ncbi:Hermansky-Pudlak syndrome 6 protein homolog isoform X2 [Cynoglossus semilaevis]|uniref:HPS6 biosis of lysosomal organelles complex 2 subunit 3 n=1 Tax=Cynoglossus semilaevis TaxID=244447 RepID=A0A3P8VHA8_CYNSE|nr:Hermansky-Pudlak syndrome 6 protein isoform X2 [Cynoglossus semilaevis]
MARFLLEQRSDFVDYNGGKELSDILGTLTSEALSDVRLSPDDRHVHVILRKPKAGLVTFDKYERIQLVHNQKRQNLRLTRSVSIVDVLYLDQNNNNNVNSSRDTTTVAVVYEDGKAEFWRFQECRSGWSLLQTSALCNSPRARVVSVCVCSGLIIWCEERPPSESSPALSSTRNKLRYCVCRRDFEVEEGAVSLGGVKIALHNNPRFTVVSSACGGLLLLLSTGWLCLLQKDGMLRQVFKLTDNCLTKYGTHTSLCMYHDTVAMMVGQNLHLIDVKCGRELEKMVLQREGLLYFSWAERMTPHLLLETGIYVVLKTDSKTSNSKVKPDYNTVECLQPGALLVEAVFEEACKYYQQRSLSSTQLTVETLKKGGKFQAPISLASILRNYFATGSKQKESELHQNGVGGSTEGQDKLMVSLEMELKALVSLDKLKGNLVQEGVKEVEVLCETLVEKEVARLLSSSELNDESLLYFNNIVRIFPQQAWKAARAVLQLHYTEEGSLSSSAPADVWKTVVSPAPASRTPDAPRLSNGGLKHHKFKDERVVNRKIKSPSSFSHAPLSVFELLCHSVFNFQPSWLPKFLELAQQQQGSVGLGLSLTTSSWSFSSVRGGEGGENNVPLYKRALSVLSSLSLSPEQYQNLEIELLLVSGRPNAILQAMRFLMAKQEWGRVTQVAQKFCKQSPLLNKEIFTTLLCEVAYHRDLDPYLDLLWSLCPEDFTVTAILNLVLKSIPSSNTPCSSYSSISTTTSPSAAPFADFSSSQLTIGLLKPLLRKVLQRETKPSQHYADILQSPLFPPPAPPPRRPSDQSRGVADAHADISVGNNNCVSAEELSYTSAQRSKVAQTTDPFCST